MVCKFLLTNTFIVLQTRVFIKLGYIIMESGSFYCRATRTKSNAIRKMQVMAKANNIKAKDPMVIKKVEKVRRRAKVYKRKDGGSVLRNIKTNVTYEYKVRPCNRKTVNKIAKKLTYVVEDEEGYRVNPPCDRNSAHVEPLTKSMYERFELFKDRHVYITTHNRLQKETPNRLKQANGIRKGRTPNSLRKQHGEQKGIGGQKQRLIAAKCGRTCVKQVKFRTLQNHVSQLGKSLKLKPNINRGQKRQATTKRFCCFGKRADRNTNKIGSYVYNKNVTKEVRMKMDDNMKGLVEMLEKKSRFLLSGMPNMTEHLKMMKHWDVPVMGVTALSTQFCVGQNYWAPMHIDKDYFYTTLSCFSLEDFSKETDEKARRVMQERVLYHFAFPEYGIAVPMRHGDVMVFDPREKHCATNPHVEDSLIVSAYTTMRMINAHVNTKLREAAGNP